MHFPEPAFSRLAHEAAVWVTVHAVQGSVPREVGTAMAVFADGVSGTIGGGRVEFEAIAQARRRLLQPGSGTEVLRYPLGPALGQCCGGVMHLRFEAVTSADVPALRQRMAVARAPVALFGGGHVGHALVEVLARLPFAVTWIDSRDGVFPPQLPAHVACEHSDPVQGAVDGRETRPLSSARGAKQLQCTLQGRTPDDDWLIVLREVSDAATVEATMQALGLTLRESEVLYWVVKGKTNRDIGDILGTSPRTVTKHLEHVFEKLGVETRTAAAALALSKVRELARS